MSFRERFYSTERTNQLLLNEIKSFDPDEPSQAWINESLPYSDIHNEWLLNNSIYKEACDTLPLYRLASIKALSFLSFRHTPEHSLPFLHDRFDHSLVVAMVSERILTRNGFSQSAVNKGIIAGLLHDIATPALGDATKSLDPTHLHEEDYWQDVLDQDGHDFLQSNAIDPQEMNGIIKNEGVHGAILDIADRITYIMKDLSYIVGKAYVGTSEITGYDELTYLVQQNNSIGNIYRDVRFDRATQQVYFNDPDRLFRLLELRGLLHYHLYQSPNTAGRDRLISRFIEPFYTITSPTNDRPLTPNVLRYMTDNDLMTFLAERYGKSSHLSDFFYTEMSSWNPEYEQFSSREDARNRETEMRQDSEIITYGIVEMKGFNPGTDYLVLSDNNQIIPFADADPKRAAILHDISEASKGIYLFYTENTDDSSLNQLLKQVYQKK